MAQLLFMTSYPGDLTGRDSPCVRCSGRGRTDLANVTQSQKFWQPSIPFVLHEGRMRSEQRKGCLWSSGSYPEFYSHFFLPRRKSNSESKSKGSEERCAFEHKSASTLPFGIVFSSLVMERRLLLYAHKWHKFTSLSESKPYSIFVIHPAVEIHFMHSPN